LIAAAGTTKGNGEGFKTLSRWLAGNDVLFLIQDREDPLILLPWRIYVELLNGRRGQGAEGGTASMTPDEAREAATQYV